jgi:hypothetical protein
VGCRVLSDGGCDVRQSRAPIKGRLMVPTSKNNIIINASSRVRGLWVRGWWLTFMIEAKESQEKRKKKKHTKRP